VQGHVAAEQSAHQRPTASAGYAENILQCTKSTPNRLIRQKRLVGCGPARNCVLFIARGSSGHAIRASLEKLDADYRRAIQNKGLCQRIFRGAAKTAEYTTISRSDPDRRPQKHTNVYGLSSACGQWQTARYHCPREPQSAKQLVPSFAGFVLEVSADRPIDTRSVFMKNAQSAWALIGNLARLLRRLTGRRDGDRRCRKRGCAGRHNSFNRCKKQRIGIAAPRHRHTKGRGGGARSNAGRRSFPPSPTVIKSLAGSTLRFGLGFGARRGFVGETGRDFASVTRLFGFGPSAPRELPSWLPRLLAATGGPWDRWLLKLAR